jgi:hypothetical protein
MLNFNDQVTFATTLLFNFKLILDVVDSLTVPKGGRNSPYFSDWLRIFENVVARLML